MKLLTVPEVAECLALKPATIRKMIFQGRLPVVRLGRSVRLKQEAIEQLIEHGTCPERREPVTR